MFVVVIDKEIALIVPLSFEKLADNTICVINDAPAPASLIS